MSVNRVTSFNQTFSALLNDAIKSLNSQSLVENPSVLNCIVKDFISINLPIDLRIKQGHVYAENTSFTQPLLLIFHNQTKAIWESEDYVILNPEDVVGLLGILCSSFKQTYYASYFDFLNYQITKVKESRDSSTISSANLLPYPYFSGIYIPDEKIISSEIIQMIISSRTKANEILIDHIGIGKNRFIQLSEYTEEGNDNFVSFKENKVSAIKADDPFPSLSYLLLTFMITINNRKWSSNLKNELFYLENIEEISHKALLSTSNLKEGSDLKYDNRKQEENQPNQAKQEGALQNYKKNGSSAQIAVKEVIEKKTDEKDELNNKAYYDINKQDNAGNSPLHYAVREGPIEKVGKLIKQGCIINIKNRQGNSPLHEAIKAGKIQIAKFLIKQGADCETVNYYKETPIHYAAQYNREDLIRMLLVHQSKLEVRNEMAYTPLHVSALSGSEKSAKLLLEAGADVDKVTKEGYTPMHIAAKYGYTHLLSLLIKFNAAINSQDKEGNTPLHLAAANGQVKIIKILVNHQANEELVNKRGETYLQRLSYGM